MKIFTSRNLKWTYFIHIALYLLRFIFNYFNIYLLNLSAPETLNAISDTNLTAKITCGQYTEKDLFTACRIGADAGSSIAHHSCSQLQYTPYNVSFYPNNNTLNTAFFNGYNSSATASLVNEYYDCHQQYFMLLFKNGVVIPVLALIPIVLHLIVKNSPISKLDGNNEEKKLLCGPKAPSRSNIGKLILQFVLRLLPNFFLNLPLIEGLSHVLKAHGSQAFNNPSTICTLEKSANLASTCAQGIQQGTAWMLTQLQLKTCNSFSTSVTMNYSAEAVNKLCLPNNSACIEGVIYGTSEFITITQRLCRDTLVNISTDLPQWLTLSIAIPFFDIVFSGIAFLLLPRTARNSNKEEENSQELETLIPYEENNENSGETTSVNLADTDYFPPDPAPS